MQLGKRSLLKTRDKLFSIGLGTWALGNEAYSPISVTESRLIIDSAIQSGVNFFDTADIYGNGLSETLLGLSLSICDRDVYVVTKGGYVDYAAKSQCFTSDYLLGALEKSLGRLRRTKVEVYLLHSPTLVSMDITELSATIGKLRASKLSNYIGVSVKNYNEASLALALGLFDCVELPFNMTYSINETAELFAAAKTASTLLIAKTPLNRGLLTNGFRNKKNFRSTDTRRSIGDDEYRRLEIMNDKLLEAARYLDRSVLELAMQWTLLNKDIMIPVPGATSSAQLDRNIEASQKPPLRTEEIEYLEKLLFSAGEDG